MLTAVVLAALLAQEQRPREADLFGQPGPAQPAPEGEGARTPPAAETAPPSPGSADDRDRAILGEPGAGPRPSTEAAPEDPLRIGGLFYLRAQSLALEDQAVRDWSFQNPSLLDMYGDARPNPRVRGFVLGRMFYDPTVGQLAQAGALEPSGATTGLDPLGAAARRGGPTVVLDQLWLRFDVAQTVFVTAGKQHVRWGTARFWMPTDYLHVRRRNPLDVFDARTGTTMLKLHLPWEAKGWNFYAYGLTETGEDVTRLGGLVGAARAEIVLGQTELGAGALVARGRKPKWALDLSTGVWDFDLYGELALRYGSEINRLGYEPAGMTIAERWPTFDSPGIKPQGVAGLSWSRQYADKDVLTIGAEYFYDGLGYGDPDVYPGLLVRRADLSEPPTFFYLGRHYAALFLLFPAPFSLDLHTFTLSTLGNLSDGSFISRLDYAYTLLTHLRLELFVAVRYGEPYGEFRFGVPPLQLGAMSFAGTSPALLDLGVALRVSL